MTALDIFITNQDIDYVRAYDLTKEAVVVWGIANTERLLVKSLRVNSVSPVAVSTGILDVFEAAFGDRLTRNVARVGRPGYPEEIADVILYLLRAESGWTKGQDITIDGGMWALGTSGQLELYAYSRKRFPLERRGLPVYLEAYETSFRSERARAFARTLLRRITRCAGPTIVSPL